MTPRKAADLIADRVFVWTSQVLTVEDREEIAQIVEGVKPVRLTPGWCAWCAKFDCDDVSECRAAFISEIRAANRMVKEG